MSLTDKELKEATDRGVYLPENKVKAIKLSYTSVLQVTASSKEALLTTASKFGLNQRTIQRVVFDK